LIIGLIVLAVTEELEPPKGVGRNPEAWRPVSPRIALLPDGSVCSPREFPRAPKTVAESGGGG
jgi:hypothetical protein